MAQRSVMIALTDMVEAIERVCALMEGVSLEAFAQDWQRQWLVERGIEIISEASRHVPNALKAGFPALPWKKIAGIGNVLRHDYGNIAAPLIWALVQEHLPELRQVCEILLKRQNPG